MDVSPLCILYYSTIYSIDTHISLPLSSSGLSKMKTTGASERLVTAYQITLCHITENTSKTLGYSVNFKPRDWMSMYLLSVWLCVWHSLVNDKHVQIKSYTGTAVLEHASYRPYSVVRRSETGKSSRYDVSWEAFSLRCSDKMERMFSDNLF